MLQKYIKNILGQMDASDAQKKLVLDMLRNIKTDEELFSEFQTLESIEFTEDDHSHFDDEVNRQLEDASPHETFTFDLSPEIEATTPNPNSTISPETLLLNPKEKQSEVFLKREETFHEGIFGLIGEEATDLLSEKGSSTAADLISEAEFDLSNHEGQSTLLASSDYAPTPQNSNESTLGRYLNLGILGKGGMGEVRKVKDQVLNRDLAMKIIHPNILRNKNALSHFIEEEQI
jgi:hypothetical protein